jgi:NADH-quinone oxidoreductase subunit L
MFVQLPAEKETGWLVPGLALSATLAGAILAIFLYRNRQSDPLNLGLLRDRFYFDELYSFLIRATQGLLAKLSAFLDRWILDGAAIRGASATTWGLGSLLRLFQVGNLQAYAFLFGLGIVGLIYFTVFR